MTDPRPIRLQLSRKKGFSLQALSLATNGLPAINVARPSRWGNPYYEGCGIGYGAFDDGMNMIRADVRLPETQVRWFRQSIEERAHSPGAYDRYLGPLRGRNLACWCKLDAPWCHADVLLDIANRPTCEPA